MVYFAYSRSTVDSPVCRRVSEETNRRFPVAAPRNDNVKEKVLSATASLLNTKSLSEITLSEIAHEAGISKGTLYYYYKNKTDIYLDITTGYLNQQYKDLIAWTDNKEKDTSIRRLIMYVVQRNIQSYQTRLHLVNAASLGDDDLRTKLTDLYFSFENLISEKVVERSNLFDPHFFAQLMLLVSDGLIIQEALHNEKFDVEKFVTQSLDYIELLDGLIQKEQQS